MFEWGKKMNNLQCKIFSAFLGAIIAGAIAFASLSFLAEFPGLDIVGMIVGIIAGGAATIFSFEKLCKKSSK